MATRTLRVLAGGLALVIAVMGIAVVPDAGLAARPSGCATHDFQIREVPSSQGAAGSFILILSYRNVSRFSCQTGGWPGVTLYARGRALPATRRTGPKGPRLVVKPGESVYSKVSYVASPQPGRICRKVISRASDRPQQHPVLAGAPAARVGVVRHVDLRRSNGRDGRKSHTLIAQWG